jgi:bis(5'-nucleosyl)-tetraphosphatase (symmetrical)
MITVDNRLNFTHKGTPWRARKNILPWYKVENRATGTTRVAFGHWSQLGLIVLPELVSLDTGCLWGRQLTAVRLDKRKPRVIQVQGQST